VDLAPFRSPIDRGAIRQSLGFDDRDIVIGHVGRFVVQKNHGKVIEVFREALAMEPRLRLLLVGEGPLRESVEQHARQAGVIDRVRFTGGRGDVPALMRGAMDVFLFPSLHEGLGLVLIEAQASGLPCLYSSTVPPEVVCVPKLMRALPLNETPLTWAKALLQQCAEPRLADGTGLQAVADSAFSIDRAVADLTSIYRQAIDAGSILRTDAWESNAAETAFSPKASAEVASEARNVLETA
jgi:glycosyltransferase involved in cell wall biosynthesis